MPLIAELSITCISGPGSGAANSCTTLPFGMHSDPDKLVTALAEHQGTGMAAGIHRQHLHDECTWYVKIYFSSHAASGWASK